MCHIFCTLLRNSVSEEKKMAFDNVMFSGVVFWGWKINTKFASCEVKGGCHLPVEEEVPKVILDNILLIKPLYCLPINMTNENQHNVLELYHMLTHFPFC